ncbi:MAG: NAD-dependent epimerase/dehydratase family protein [Chloroflexi bacterium]|nr:NAD-dependent epimerase/dehydratase family protein [Chloroflexota bacterium]
MKMLVTGGTGFLGRHLARALLQHDHRVHLLGRNFTQSADLLSLGAQPVPVDLRDRAATIAACEGMDAVFHVGALSAPWGHRADFFAINVDGTANVIAGCQRHDVGQLIYVSSPSVVFDGRDHWNLAEAAPYPRRFASIYSLTKKLGEDLVNQAAGTRLPAVILRPKAIFGPGDTSLLPRLIDAARRGRLPQIGDGRNLVDLTYVDNVVQALLLVLSAPAAVGRTYTITNGEHVPLWQVIRTVLQHQGLSTKLRRVPLNVALLAAAIMEARAAITGREPLLTRYSAAILARTQTYSISAAQRDLHYAPQISVAEGITRTLAALGSPETTATHA